MKHAWTRVVLALGAAAVCAVLVFAAFVPRTTGVRGFSVYPVNGNPRALVIDDVREDAPAYRAGLRPGDVIDTAQMSPLETARLFAARAGEPVRVAVRRGSALHSVVFSPKPAPSANGLLNIAVPDLLILLYLVLSLLIAFRGGGRPQAGAIAGFIFWAAVNAALQQLVLTAPSASTSAFAVIAQDFTASLVYYNAFLLGAVFPARDTFASRLSMRMRILMPALIFAAMLYHIATTFYPVVNPVFGARQLSDMLPWGLIISGYACFWVVMIDALLHGDRSHRAQVLWITSSLIVGTLLECTRAVFYGFVPGQKPAWLGALLLLEVIGPLGAAYAVLRHKVVDLQFVISRATVFGAVSVVLVALFIALEWIAATLAEAAFGHMSGRDSEFTGFAIAMIVGLSARNIHGAIERILNDAFFRKRKHNLEALRRFAIETDVATDALKLIGAVYETLQRHADGEFAGVYLAHEGVYARKFGSAAPLPDLVDENHPVMLRLRRFAEPFEVEERHGVFAHSLLLPMSVLGRTVGFIVAGPKRDHTAYLRDEVEALAVLTHRAGTAYWLLQSSPGVPATV